MVSPAIKPNLTMNPGGSSSPGHVLPTLFGDGYNNYPVQSRSYLYSVILHGAGVALFVLAGLWVKSKAPQIKQQLNATMVDISPYIMQIGKNAGGGGGGGDHEKLEASKGALPLSAREQFTPPTVLVREQPKLPIAPTVVAPTIKMAPMQMGDPLAAMAPPSNGIGGNAGIGNGEGTGVGAGSGPGVGNGWGGGIGGGAYVVGGGVSGPVPLYTPDPEYSQEAREAKYQGSVVLWIIVGPDGRVHDVKVQRSLGMGLDQNAIASVKTWKFKPGMKDGHPVAVQMSVDVAFRLY